jgi:hypothetical protein
VAKNKDKEREFRLRPRKPAARGERRAYASAYKIIMHHARMSGMRKRRVVGLGTRTTHTRPYSQRCAVRVLYSKNSSKGVLASPRTLRPPRVPLARVIHGPSGLVSAKKPSTSPGGSRTGRKRATSECGS